MRVIHNTTCGCCPMLEDAAMKIGTRIVDGALIWDVEQRCKNNHIPLSVDSDALRAAHLAAIVVAENYSHLREAAMQSLSKEMAKMEPGDTLMVSWDEKTSRVTMTIMPKSATISVGTTATIRNAMTADDARRIIDAAHDPSVSMGGCRACKLIAIDLSADQLEAFAMKKRGWA